MTEAKLTSDVTSNLKRWNITMGILHLVQSIAIAVLGLTNDIFREFEQRIYTFYLTPIFDDAVPDGPPIDIGPTPEVFITFTGIAPVLLSLFLFASAVAHLSIAFPLFGRYIRGLEKGINQYRWYEYAISSSIMIVFIMLTFGIVDFWLMVAIFILNAVMNIFGLYMEKYNQFTNKTNWEPYIWGWIAGIIPWIVILDNFNNLNLPEGLELPSFIYIAIAIYFFFFNTFAFNMLFQYLKVGPWKNYIFGERVYQVLSLVAKSALCWLVFGGILAAAAS